MPLMTKEKYAELGIPQADGTRKKVSKAYLSKGMMAQRLAGAMEMDMASGRMMLNSDKADEIITETKDPSRGMSHMNGGSGLKPTKGAKIGAFEQIKTDNARVKLEHEQLDLADRKKQLLTVKDVIVAAAAVAQIIQSNFKSRERRLAEKFSTMKDAGEIAAIMAEEDRALLQQCSDDFHRRLPNIQQEGDPVTAH